MSTRQPTTGTETPRRLGADVGFVGRVGQDTFGPMTIDNLQAEGIDTSTRTQTSFPTREAVEAHRRSIA
jgi:sugar/nucleoside kinase (ribokinase family)